MRYSKDPQAGFTLLELLLYISIVSSMLLVLSYFFVGTASTKISNQVENNVNQQASFIMDTMLQSIRNSDSVTAPAANSTASQLTLAVPASANTPTIFALSGSAATIKEGSASAIPLTSSSVIVSNLTFKNTMRTGTPGSIQVSFTLSANSTSSRSEFSYQRTFTSSASVRQ